MIRIGQRDLSKSVTVTMQLAGEEFEIELMPLPAKERIRVFTPFFKTGFRPNPITKKMDFVSYPDRDNEKYDEAANDLLCEVVKSWSGLGDMDGNVLPVTRDNIIILGKTKIEDIENIELFDPDNPKQKAVMPQKVERLFRDMIFEKAAELAETIAESSAKNSLRPSNGNSATALNTTMTTAILQETDA